MFQIDNSEMFKKSPKKIPGKIYFNHIRTPWLLAKSLCSIYTDTSALETHPQLKATLSDIGGHL
jgi:hypothetical protein